MDPVIPQDVLAQLRQIAAENDLPNLDGGWFRSEQMKDLTGWGWEKVRRTLKKGIRDGSIEQRRISLTHEQGLTMGMLAGGLTILYRVKEEAPQT